MIAARSSPPQASRTRQAGGALLVLVLAGVPLALGIGFTRLAEIAAVPGRLVAGRPAFREERQ